MEGENRGLALRIVVAATIAVVLFVGMVGIGTASGATDDYASPSETTITTSQESANVSEQIRDAIPESVLDELPEGFLGELLAGDQVTLSQDILAQLDRLNEIPDSLLESVLLDIIDNIPEQVLQNPTDFLDNPPDAIPAILCRASDMEDKAAPEGKEIWGPTDANAQTANHNLTVLTNELGTVTGFKYPSRSFSDQVKHHAMDRREPYYGSDPNAGTFLGLIYTTESGDRRFDWLRDWGPVSTTDSDHAEHVDQEWASQMSDTLLTEFTNESLGLTVTLTDAVPSDVDVHIRDVAVDADADSPVTDVEVVSYANFNLVDNKDALIPTQDWCDESENDADVTYNESSDAIVYETPAWDPALPEDTYERAGPEFSIGTAMRFDGQSTQHHVAGDAYRTNHSEDPYSLLSNGTLDLPGNDSFVGQVSTALTRDIDFSDGSGHARVYFGAASDQEPHLDVGDEAVDAIERVDNRSLEAIVDTKEAWFEQYIGDAPMPTGAPENVTGVSRRAHVSLVHAWDPITENRYGFSGSVIESATTQGPYGVDWIRPGAYFNYAYDRWLGENASGLDQWVDRHNRWYMSLQQNPNGECPRHCNDNMEYYDLGLGIIPDAPILRTVAADELPFMSATHSGSWAMNYYADGIPAGPLGSEIDQTGYGTWTFWDHYAVTENETYLQRIYPAIRLGGDRLTEGCVDEETGLQCARPEDDNTEYTQTAVGGASAFAGLDAATKAAAEMYRLTGEEEYAEDALAYAQRRDELRVAIDEHYWQEDAGTYGSSRVVFPGFLRPLDDPRMQRQLQHMWETVDQVFQGEVDAGQYEAKSLVGLGVAARVTDDPPVTREQLQSGIEWLADNAARAETTHVMGESWIRESYADGEVDATVSQPHTWEHQLVYMAALLAYGNESITDGDRIGHEAYAEWRRHDATVTAVESDDTVSSGNIVNTTVTVQNEAPLDQEYHLTYDLVGPNGTQYSGTATDVGPIDAGGTETTTLSWDAGDAPTGAYNATVTAWKAAATDDSGEPDPLAIAEEPTALSTPEYRHVALNRAGTTVTLSDEEPDGEDNDTTAGTDDDSDTNESATEDADDDGPGFTVVVAFLALLGATILVKRGSPSSSREQ